jgi:hypothetical protein
VGGCKHGVSVLRKPAPLTYVTSVSAHGRTTPRDRSLKCLSVPPADPRHLPHLQPAGSPLATGPHPTYHLPPTLAGGPAAEDYRSIRPFLPVARGVLTLLTKPAGRASLQGWALRSSPASAPQIGHRGQQYPRTPTRGNRERRDLHIPQRGTKAQKLEGSPREAAWFPYRLL